MRVAILPTGRLEWEALPRALKRLFPQADFYALPTPAEVETQQAIAFPAPSFTSCDVKRLHGVESNADKLLQRAAAEAVGDRTRDAADLVVIVDDLELVNLHQSAAVIAVMREAAERHLARLANNQRAATRHQAALRERVSFHLAKPMIEGWFFADPRGPHLAGVPTGASPSLVAGQDPEEFQTQDPVYESDAGAHCTAWLALADQARKRCRPPWLRAGAQRHLHPKAYLAWLCREPGEKTCSGYAETAGGAAALAALDWAALLADPQHARFARALTSDIADALGQPPPFRGLMAPETAPKSAPALLRNL